jgi:uncharacterized protein (DUF488 family)
MPLKFHYGVTARFKTIAHIFENFDKQLRSLIGFSQTTQSLRNTEAKCDINIWHLKRVLKCRNNLWWDCNTFVNPEIN